MNIDNAALAMIHYINNDIPAMMWSAPGIGKSDTARAVQGHFTETTGNQWGLCDFRASTRDQIALMGLPRIEGNHAKWCTPNELPQIERDGEYGIFFADELTNCNASMQTALLGLILDRKIGEYTLPPKWRIIAAGNRQSDKAGSNKMVSSLANRFAHIDIEACSDTFRKWCNVPTNKVHPVIPAFIGFRPNLLHDMTTADLRAFPTPRQWANVGKICSAPDSLRHDLVTGLVGETASGEFEGFFRVWKNLPTIESILNDPHNAIVPPTSEPGAQWAIATALARKADRDTFKPILDYAQRLPVDFEIIVGVDAVKRDESLKETAPYTQWAIRNQNVTL